MVSMFLRVNTMKIDCWYLALIKQARKFFVGGNFKSNGTISSIKAIVENLNKATLNPAVGKFLDPRKASDREFSLINNTQRSSFHPQQSTFSSSGRSSGRMLLLPPRTSTIRATVHTLVKSVQSNLRMLVYPGPSLGTARGDPFWARATRCVLSRCGGYYL